MSLLNRSPSINLNGPASRDRENAKTAKADGLDLLRREPRLLRASHIKPWARCETDAERLDVYNGLLLAAHLDAAFDVGLISFSDEGAILISAHFTEADRRAIGIQDQFSLRRVGRGHLPNLAWHRTFLIGSSALAR
jgi:putative restriction endonuclease